MFWRKREIWLQRKFPFFKTFPNSKNQNCSTKLTENAPPGLNTIDELGDKIGTSQYSIQKQLHGLAPVQDIPKEEEGDYQDQFLGTQNFIISAANDIEFILDDVAEEVVTTEEEVIYSGEKGAGLRINSDKEGKVTYKCDLCSYSTNRSTNYNTHYKMVHLKSRTLCQLCGKEYSNISQHLRVIHKVLRSGVTQKRRCETCHQEFYDLVQHLRRAHGLVTEREARCEDCGKMFSKQANMLRHRQSA